MDLIQLKSSFFENFVITNKLVTVFKTFICKAFFGANCKAKDQIFTSLIFAGYQFSCFLVNYVIDNVVPDKCWCVTG